MNQPVLTASKHPDMFNVKQFLWVVKHELNHLPKWWAACTALYGNAEAAAHCSCHYREKHHQLAHAPLRTFFMHVESSAQATASKMYMFSPPLHVLRRVRTDQWGPSCCALSSQWHKARAKTKWHTVKVLRELGQLQRDPDSTTN